MSEQDNRKSEFNPLYKVMQGKTYGTSKTMIHSMADTAASLAEADSASSVKDYKGRAIRAERILVLTKDNLLPCTISGSEYMNVKFIKAKGSSTFCVVPEDKLTDVEREDGNYYMAVTGTHFALVQEDKSIDFNGKYVVNVAKSASISNEIIGKLAERLERGTSPRLDSPSANLALKATALARSMSGELKAMVKDVILAFIKGNAKNKRENLVKIGVDEEDANLYSGMYSNLSKAFSTVCGVAGAIGTTCIMPFIYCAIIEDWSKLRNFSIMTKMCDEHWTSLRFDVPEVYLKKSVAYTELKLAKTQKGIWKEAPPDFDYSIIMDFLAGNTGDDPLYSQCENVMDYWVRRFAKTSFDIVGTSKTGDVIIEGGYAFSVKPSETGNEHVFHLGTVGIQINNITVGKVDKTSATQYLNASLLKSLDQTPKNELRDLYMKTGSLTYPFLNLMYSSKKSVDWFKQLANEDADLAYVTPIKNLLINEAMHLITSEVLGLFKPEWVPVFKKAFEGLEKPLCGNLAEVMLFQTVCDHDAMLKNENVTKREQLYNNLTKTYKQCNKGIMSLIPIIKKLVGSKKNGNVGTYSLLMTKEYQKYCEENP